MQPIDLSSSDVPVFIPDVDSWTQPNCNYVNVDELLLSESCIAFSVLMLNVRSCKKKITNFLLTFAMF